MQIWEKPDTKLVFDILRYWTDRKMGSHLSESRPKLSKLRSESVFSTLAQVYRVLVGRVTGNSPYQDSTSP
jgi:hypothetical protein